MFRLLLGLVFISAFAPVPVWAGQEVALRSGVHSSYNRLVFDWPDPPSYSLSQKGATLHMSFQKAADLDLNAFKAEGLPNIKNLKVLSGKGDNLEISIDIPEGSRFRHFSAGGRIVVDVYNQGGKVSAASAKEIKSKEKPAVKEEPAGEGIREDVKEDVEDMQAAAPEDVETAVLPPPDVDPHVITVTATQVLGMAVFERAGWLWLVMDDPGISVLPQISGPQKDRFGDPVRYELPEGVAYRLELPQGLNVRGEGGGLLWRIVASPAEKEIEHALPEKAFEGDDPLRGGVLRWPLSNVRKILDVKDPVFGDVIKVVTVEEAGQSAGASRAFPDLESLPSAIGLAVLPKVDDLGMRMAAEGAGVEAFRAGGLILSRDKDVKPVEMREEAQAEIVEEEKSPLSRIYNFDRWEMGGVRALDSNQQVLMATLGAKNKNGRAQDLMTLAKLMLANDRGYESLGYLRVAAQELPGVSESPEYLALRGGARALSGKHDSAIEDLSDPSLQDYGELGYWKAFTLAGLEDWQQAISVLPEGFDVLAGYPPQLRQPVALALSEVALRAGKTDLAEGLLGMLEMDMKEMLPPYQAAWNYLMGEMQRQLGNTDKAKEYWEPLVKGKDDLYRAKAGLSLTRLQLENKDITPAQAIDRLEGLRYAWRGDELETLVNLRLGHVYIDNGDYLKGLSVLRNAVSLQPGSKIAQQVANYMGQVFRDLFMKEGVYDIPPLEAVTIYDEFKELTPAGEEGDKFTELLAERLVEADLLGRAAKILENQVAHRLEGEEKARLAVRLAGVRLLDRKPEGALRALDVAEETYKDVFGSEGIPLEREREIKLLRARAFSKLKKTDQALALLDQLPNEPVVSRLRTDVAWNAGRWDEAADAFQDLILSEDISLKRPLTDYQRDLILNRAIALNLSGNRVGLTNLRERFKDSMKETEKHQFFDVVTRPRQLGLIGSREQVMSLISEVDLFKDFLESYRKTGKAQE
ncbi:MAG: tetratricopeptide repeat protein [Rhodospirillales bacterium]|nr:tetratricopeptide repeat protein [Alphaproteobacteria bacterium]USO02970.1 MAG: tetratricopeptide repeat protein [Rhodospirillales bacterium]